MIKAKFLLPCAFLFFTAATGSLTAQEKKSSVVDLNAIMKVGEVYFHPAAFVLAHRKELALTDAQVKSVDSLDKAEPFDVMDYAHPDSDEKSMGEMLMNVAVPIDSVVVRRGVQARVERETKMMLDRARSTRRLQLLLTPMQRTALVAAEMRTTFELMDAKSPETKHE